MSVDSPIISDCPACGEPMDITALAPFTLVSCPSCEEKTRVKLDFGPYRLEQRLAVGGMSVVFTARDTLLDRVVAVKILNEDYSADERRINAFEQEARVTASLSHPNIVRVLTTGRAYGRFFIAMELVPGGHFEQHIRAEEKIPVERMLRLAIQIANGLKAAHAANLIHRDIKPGNILLDAAGNAKIVDFGLALATQGGTARADEFWATPYYVPPETIDGQPEDFRSDIYAFGATLYHALAGKPPCNEKSMATDVLRTAKRQVVPLHLVEPDLPLAVCEIVEKAMAYRPDDRYDCYDGLIRDLEAAADPAKHGVLRITAGEAANRRTRARRTRRFLLSCASLVAAIAAAVAIVWIANRGVTHSLENENAVAATTDAEDPPADNQEEAPAATVIDVALLLDEANEAMISRRYGDACSQFGFIYRHPQVREPTRTWSGVQAAMAAFLAGDAGDARSLCRDIERQSAEAGIDDPGFEHVVLPVVRRVARRETVPREPTTDDTMDAPLIIARMLAGLHNWQHGEPGSATPFLRDVAEATPDESAQWLAHYLEFAADCLRDKRLLDDPVFDQEPADLAAAETALERLNVISQALATPGRASQIVNRRRRDIRAIRDDFIQEKESMENDVSPEGEIPDHTPPEADPASPQEEPEDEIPPMERIQSHLADYEFARARRLIRSLNDEQVPPRGRNVWMTLTRSAQEFMSSLVDDLAGYDATPPINEVLLKSGDTLADIRIHESLEFLAAADGEIIPWQDIHPDTYIDLHRARVRMIGEPDARTRAHESAIAFDLLAGDRRRATTAIQRLGEVDPNFQRYWRIILEQLPN